MFENPEIPLEALPNLESPAWERLHPRYVRCLQLQLLLGALIPFIPATIVSIFAPGPVFVKVLMWLIVLGVAAILLTWPVIAPRLRRQRKGHHLPLRCRVSIRYGRPVQPHSAR